MAHYMLQFAYTTDAWKTLMANPVDRSAAIRALGKKMGGKLVNLYYTMGDYDGVAILDAPDDQAAMSMVLAAAGAGHLRVTKTTRLYSPGETIAALEKARDANYPAPKA